MNKVIATERLPIKLWVTDLEEGALEQAKNLANLPFVFKHVALMPDAHQGYGMPIGGVLATKEYIVPNAVGVDIGCGMCAVKTSLTELDTETLKKILGKIRQAIPVGFDHHKEAQDESLMPNRFNILVDVVDREYESALKQLGTLGGGNHFIEIQSGSDKHIWIMLHSGSRNIGLKVANEYNIKAKQINERYFSSVTKDKDLAFLHVDSEEGAMYIDEMGYCVEFALANRNLMMERIKDIFRETVQTHVLFEPTINIAHNYAKLERHFDEDVWVHRKGATLAEKGTIGIIPGSQGTYSYIVKGRGDCDSFNSCSHGAGRKMGRNEARKKLNLEEEKKKLDDRGILHAIRSEQDLDEASGAYKDIGTVMKNQEDLVEILVELKPLGVIKA